MSGGFLGGGGDTSFLTKYKLKGVGAYKKLTAKI